MIVAVDLEQITDAAFAEAERWPPRTPERRAAGHLWIALTIPPAKSVDAAKAAIASFGTPQVHHQALELLHRLAHRVQEDQVLHGGIGAARGSVQR